MATASAEPAFSRSLADFKKRLSQKDCERFSLTTFEDLRNAIDRIQREQGLRRSYRNLNKIKPFISTLQQYALVIEQFVNAKSDFLAFIWGPMKLCLQIASRLVEAFDCLLDAYARLGEALPIFSAVDNLFSPHVPGHVQQTLANIYEDILKFHQRATVFFKQRAWTIAFKTTFRSFGDMFGDIVNKLSRSKELLIQTASVSEFQEAQNARLLITREFEAQRERDEKEQKLSVVEWLSHVTCHSQHEELQERRRVFPSTTRWIFDTTATSEWFRDDDESGLILYVYGIPGAGKTFLFNSIVDEIGKRAPASHVVYFYCKESDPFRRSFNEIARSLIGQLLALNPACLNYLYERTLNSGERIPTSTYLCKDILKSLTATHENLFIGIDGLDECEEPERRHVLDLISGILINSSTQRNVRIFLTSRKEKDIGGSIGSAIQMEIKPHHLEQDIKYYVQVRVSELNKKFGLSMDEKVHISRDVAKRSDGRRNMMTMLLAVDNKYPGMFLLARLIMDNLIDQDFPDELREELRSEVLPKGIDEAYGRILRRMNKKYITKKGWGRAKLGLDLLALAKRSIMPHEIQGAISICLETKSIEFQERRSVTPLAELLGPMVEIHADGSVDFIHPTARDYLLQEHSCHFIDMATAQLRLAQLCTSYMTFNCFNRGLDESAIKDAVLRGDYSFQEYAIFNWIHHVDYLVKHEQVWSTDETSSIKDSLALLCKYHLEQSEEPPSSSDKKENVGAGTRRSESLEDLRRIYDCTDSLSQEGSHQGSIPYLASRVVEVRRILEEFSAEVPKQSLILTEAYGIMLFKCPIINCTRFYQGFSTRQQRDKHLGQHERPHKCTYEGCDYMELGFPTEAELRRHIELCHRALREEPTFPNVRRVNLSKALNDAINRDDVQAVRDICSEISVCPLRQTGFVLRAMKRGSISTALVLVELLGTDVEMNHVDSKGRTALHEAVQIRNDGLFDRILETGIEFDVRDCEGFTPYWRALRSGYFHAIRSLMDHAAIDLIPQKCQQAHDIYYNGMKEAADAGVNDILKAQFSNFVTVSQSYYKFTLEILINDDLNRIIEKAALNRHESTVKLILELAHALDLESMYRGLLKKKLHDGIEAMTKFLLQHYGEAKRAIGKNGKTYGNAIANAAMKDDTALVMRLLKDGANIDYATPQLSYNALGAASARGKLSMVELLVEQGADVNAKGGYSGNALYLACVGGHMAVVNFLFEKGADLNARLTKGDTALIGASGNKCFDAVRFLIEKAADVNLQNRYGQTALFTASQEGFKEIVGILLQNGADINLQSNKGETALFPASRIGHKETVEILLQGGADVNLQSESGETALFSASRYGYKEVVETLLQGGADVNLQSKSGETALFTASHFGHKEVAEILVQRGADVNLETKNLESKSGQTALFVAFERGRRGVVDVLVKAEVDTEVKDINHRTVLLQAAYKGWEDIVQILIDKGADVDSVDADQQTALLIASKKGHLEVVKILIQGGADVNLHNGSGETALFTAYLRGYNGIVEILVQGGAARENPLFVAFGRGEREAVHTLIKDEVDIKLKDSHQWTALWQAAAKGWEDIVQILIYKGADINSIDMDQQTALLIASRKGHIETVKTLIQAGADVNMENRFGETALSVAAHWGHVEVVRILLAGGAKGLEAALSTAFINKDVDALQPLLMLASRSQQRTAVQVFLEGKTDVSKPDGLYENALSSACAFGMEESVEVLLEVGAQLPIPAGMYDRVLGLIESMKYLQTPKYEAIAKLLRERRALAALLDFDDFD